MQRAISVVDGTADRLPVVDRCRGFGLPVDARAYPVAPRNLGVAHPVSSLRRAGRYGPERCA